MNDVDENDSAGLNMRGYFLSEAAVLVHSTQHFLKSLPAKKTVTFMNTALAFQIEERFRAFEEQLSMVHIP